MWGEPTSKWVLVFTVMIQFLASGWPETSFPCHVGISTGLRTTWQLNSLRASALRGGRERGLAGMKLPFFCNLIWKVAFHHFHNSLFIRYKTLVSVQTQRQRITQKQKYQKELLGTHLRSCLPQCPRSNKAESLFYK